MIHFYILYLSPLRKGINGKSTKYCSVQLNIVSPKVSDPMSLS